MSALFITGTDTEVGKTHVSVALLNQLKAMGLSTRAFKPIASGCQRQQGQWVNDDALQLQAAATVLQPYQIVNPIAFEPAIAPHIAADQIDSPIETAIVKQQLQQMRDADADISLIEGFGGWAVPLNKHDLFSDVIAELKLPTVLVVGIRLGCLNHATLSIHMIRDMQVPLVGWVANCIDPDTRHIDAQIATLKQQLNAPLLGTLEHHDAREMPFDLLPIVDRIPQHIKQL